jgi:hypothetical protein
LRHTQTIINHHKRSKRSFTLIAQKRFNSKDRIRIAKVSAPTIYANHYHPLVRSGHWRITIHCIETIQFKQQETNCLSNIYDIRHEIIATNQYDWNTHPLVRLGHWRITNYYIETIQSKQQETNCQSNTYDTQHEIIAINQYDRKN